MLVVVVVFVVVVVVVSVIVVIEFLRKRLAANTRSNFRSLRKNGYFRFFLARTDIPGITRVTTEGLDEIGTCFPPRSSNCQATLILVRTIEFLIRPEMYFFSLLFDWNRPLFGLLGTIRITTEGLVEISSVILEFMPNKTGTRQCTSWAVHFIVRLPGTLWVQLGGWTDRPKPKHSIKFSVGLLQPAYAFVSDMSVLTNSP